jgi:uncharacterized phage protein
VQRRIRPAAKTYPCPKCKGTGKLSIEIVNAIGECKECKGTGKVTTRPKDYIDKLYDGFKKKDMTRVAFRAAFKRTMDPVQMHRDLDDLLLTRQVRREINRGRSL